MCGLHVASHASSIMNPSLFGFKRRRPVAVARALAHEQVLISIKLGPPPAASSEHPPGLREPRLVGWRLNVCAAPCRNIPTVKLVLNGSPEDLEEYAHKVRELSCATTQSDSRGVIQPECGVRRSQRGTRRSLGPAAEFFSPAGERCASSGLDASPCSSRSLCGSAASLQPDHA